MIYRAEHLDAFDGPVTVYRSVPGCRTPRDVILTFSDEKMDAFRQLQENGDIQLWNEQETEPHPTLPLSMPAVKVPGRYQNKYRLTDQGVETAVELFQAGRLG